MNPNNYDTGVPPNDAYTRGSLGTQVQSHIPGTQAHREREYLQHEDRAAGRNQPPMNAVPGTGAGTGVGAQNTTGFGPTDTFAPANQPGQTAPGLSQGAGQTYGATNAPGVGTGTGTGTTGGNLHKHGHTGTGMGTGTTGAVGNGTVPKKGPHIGDKITGSIESTIGRAVNSSKMEQAGWERKTFGTEAAKQGGVHPSTTKQPY